jgi:uncharacterized protein
MDIISLSTSIEFFGFVIAGAVVGLAVGLTGVGGGSLMTPALVSGFGIPANIAVGTDLAFAAITKSAGVGMHRNSGAIRWPIATLMIVASVPSCAISLWLMTQFPPSQNNSFIKTALGIALLGTVIAILIKDRVKMPHIRSMWLRSLLTVLFASIVGTLVAWTSIGAGAIGCSVLALIHSDLSPAEIAATDIAYAVPLTGLAALGHGIAGNIDPQLLVSLLCGSVPGIWLGIKLGAYLNRQTTKFLLAAFLTGAAIKSLTS